MALKSAFFVYNIHCSFKLETPFSCLEYKYTAGAAYKVSAQGGLTRAHATRLQSKSPLSYAGSETSYAKFFLPHSRLAFPETSAKCSSGGGKGYIAEAHRTGSHADQPYFARKIPRRSPLARTDSGNSSMCRAQDWMDQAGENNPYLYMPHAYSR